MARQRLTNTDGFTLTELLTTLCIVVVVLMYGVPALVDTMISNRLANNANAFLAALNSARAEAVSRGQSVAMCPSVDGRNCSAQVNWHVGWLIFSDLDANLGMSSQCVADGRCLIAVGQGLAGNTQLIASDSQMTYLLFDSRGRSRRRPSSTLARTLASGAVAIPALANASFTLCGEEKGADADSIAFGLRSRIIDLQITGRAALRKADSADQSRVNAACVISSAGAVTEGA